MGRLLKVATRSDVPEGDRGLVVETFGRQIAIFKVGEQFHALDNRCLHEGASLGDGVLEGACITCPWHGWQYDVVSGACRSNPRLSLRVFPTRVEGNDILIEL
jgi:nitrite reductase/ring-hydroxylating ferredoxin subunit